MWLERLNKKIGLYWLLTGLFTDSISNNFLPVFKLKKHFLVTFTKCEARKENHSWNGHHTETCQLTWRFWDHRRVQWRNCLTHARRKKVYWGCGEQVSAAEEQLISEPENMVKPEGIAALISIKKLKVSLRLKGKFSPAVSPWLMARSSKTALQLMKTTLNIREARSDRCSAALWWRFLPPPLGSLIGQSHRRPAD